jgi:hypothetical protein
MHVGSIQIEPMMTRITDDRESEPRNAGSLKGKVWLAPDWGSGETNEEIAKDFYGEDDERDPLFRPEEPQPKTRTTEP